LGDGCAIFMIEEGTVSLLPAATYHPDSAQARVRNELLRRHPLRIGNASATGRAAATGQSVVIKHATTDPRMDRAYVGPLQLQSYIAVPMITQGRILGVLGTSHTTPGKEFTDRDLTLAMAVADRAALAIENARLLTSERQRQQQLQTILEINREIVGERDPQRLFPLIAHRARMLLGGYGVVLL